MPPWSLPSANSSAAAIMPWLNTPRSLRAPSTNGSPSTILAGTVDPGGNQIAHIPACTFGAPHTTCTRPFSSRGTSRTDLPSSIFVICNRSASGCFSHSTTFTIVAPRYRSAKLITSSTPPNWLLIFVTKLSIFVSGNPTSRSITATFTFITIYLWLIVLFLLCTIRHYEIGARIVACRCGNYAHLQCHTSSSQVGQCRSQRQSLCIYVG